MTFPVYSTAVQTKPLERVVRVLQRCINAKMVERAGVYNCRKIAGSTTWSQHAWGNAVDLFPTESKYNDEIANMVVRQATKKTVPNRGRPLAVAQVIDHLSSRIWTPATGWGPYGGTVGPHVHVTASPMCLGVPACAKEL